MTTQQEQNLAAAMSHASLKADQGLPMVKFARRSSRGTLGTEVRAVVNYFSIDCSRLQQIFEYSISICSKEEDDAKIFGRVRERIITLLLEKRPAVSFDHAATDYSRKCWTTRCLTPHAEAEYSCEIDYFEPEETGPGEGHRKQVYTVTLALQKVLKMDDYFRLLTNDDDHHVNTVEEYQAALSMMMVRYPAQRPDMITAARRSKFFRIGSTEGHAELTGGLGAYSGFFRAVVPISRGLALNLNTTATAVIQEGCLDQVIRAMRNRRHEMHLSDSEMAAHISRMLKNCRVEHTYTGQRRADSVHHIASTATIPFPTAAEIHVADAQSAGRNTTLEQSFANLYPWHVRQNKQAAVVVLASKDKTPIYVPSDVLHVQPANLYRGALPTPTQTSNMIKFARRRPEQNRAMITSTGLQQLGIRSADGPHNRFQLLVTPTMMPVTGRRLPAPVLKFSGAADPGLGGGVWNLKGRRFVKPAPKPQMVFSYLELLLPGQSSCPNLNNFLKAVESALCQYCGVENGKVTYAVRPELHSHQMTPDQMSTRTALTALLRRVWGFMVRKGIRLCFVILPHNSAEIYGSVKITADCLEGLHTICTVRKADGKIKDGPGEIANLMLKFNQKLGGVQHSLEVDKAGILKQVTAHRLMFMGADVGHPSPGSMQDAPSIAAVVATTDSTYFQYAGCVRLQRHHDEGKKSIEFILDLEGMAVERLRLYQKRNNGHLPEMIFMYRDGIADSMFGTCLEKEYTQLRRACQQVYQGQSLPRLAYIVAQKRHHTRFYKHSNGPSTAFDPKGNPLPGVIFDSDVTHPTMYDWFAYSHACIEGTSRAAHYVVLRDETSLSANELQFLTYCHSFLFGRCTRSISIHPAARYADLLCDRARLYMRNVYNPPSPHPGQDRPKYRSDGGHWPGVFHDNIKDSMFFT